MSKCLSRLLICFALTAGAVQAENITEGTGAGAALTSGDNNIFIGTNAGSVQATVSENIFIGDLAGSSNTSGYQNVFLGSDAGRSITSGYGSVFIGHQSGESTTTGRRNAFVGAYSGSGNTTGYDNTYLGYEAGFNMKSGWDNVAIGDRAMYGSLTDLKGGMNTAAGYNAAYSLNNGWRNTALGNSAGYGLVDGVANTLFGDNAGGYSSYADFSTFAGFAAGLNNNRDQSSSTANANSAFGAFAGSTNVSGSENLWIGTLADTSPWVFDHDTEIVTYDGVGGAAPARLSGPQGAGNGPINNNNNVSNSTVIGARANVAVNAGVSFGYAASVSGSNGIALGSNATVSHSNAIAIGDGSASFADNGIALGNGSTTAIVPGADLMATLGSANQRLSNVVSHGWESSAPNNQNSQITLFADNASQDDDIWRLATVNNGGLVLQSKSSGSFVSALSVTSTGDLTVAGNVVLNSDKRLKQDIRSIDNAFAGLKGLSAKRYYWNPELMRDPQRQIGLIAQDVEESLPELVSSTNSGVKSVDYIGLIPVLLNAIKEQQKDIDRRELMLVQLAQFLDQQEIK